MRERESQNAIERHMQESERLLDIGDKAYKQDKFVVAQGAYLEALEHIQEAENNLLPYYRSERLQSWLEEADRTLSAVLARTAQTCIKTGDYPHALTGYEQGIRLLEIRRRLSNRGGVRMWEWGDRRSNINVEAPSNNRYQLLVLSLILAVIMLGGCVIAFRFTGNPLTLLALQIPVFFFALVSFFLIRK